MFFLSLFSHFCSVCIWSIDSEEWRLIRTCPCGQPFSTYFSKYVKLLMFFVESIFFFVLYIAKKRKQRNLNENNKGIWDLFTNILDSFHFPIKFWFWSQHIHCILYKKELLIENQFVISFRTIQKLICISLKKNNN